MGQLCRVAGGQVCLGIWTCQKLELHFEICLGSSKFTGDSFLELELYMTSCNPVHLTHHVKLQRTSDIAPLWGAYVEYPLPIECGTCAMATGISEKIGGPHIEDSQLHGLRQHHQPQVHSAISRITAGIHTESHLIPLPDGLSVSHLWWLWIELVEDSRRTHQKVCCSPS